MYGLDTAQTYIACRLLNMSAKWVIPLLKLSSGMQRTRCQCVRDAANCRRLPAGSVSTETAPQHCSRVSVLAVRGKHGKGGCWLSLQLVLVSVLASVLVSVFVCLCLCLCLCLCWCLCLCLCLCLYMTLKLLPLAHLFLLEKPKPDTAFLCLLCCHVLLNPGTPSPDAFLMDSGPMLCLAVLLPCVQHSSAASSWARRAA